MTNIQLQFENIFEVLRICVLAWKRNIKRVLSPYAEMISFSFWSGCFTDQVIEQTLIQSGRSQGGLINITHNDSARTKWLLSSYILANYTEALRDLTGLTTGTRSEQHQNVQASRQKENNGHLSNFIDFFDIHNLFKVLV